MTINIPLSAEEIAKRTHFPLWAVKKALGLLERRGLATRTASGTWKATANGAGAAEEGVQDA